MRLASHVSKAFVCMLPRYTWLPQTPEAWRQLLRAFTATVAEILLATISLKSLIERLFDQQEPQTFILYTLYFILYTAGAANLANRTVSSPPAPPPTSLDSEVPQMREV